ncbi:MAG TPA: phage terminase large subunit family protein [Phycisphaerae bacterium]|nr:phage terminase large subunit family protein [Phycisphaerae bacterium]
MPLDPRRLRPTELTQLINSSSFGEVTSDRQLRRHRRRAGRTIGDGDTVDLFRYAAWLTKQHCESLDDSDCSGAREAKLKWSRQQTRLRQEIGDIPAVVNPERKEAACDDFRKFCETYFSELFYLPWSKDHYNVIEKIERAVCSGGLFAVAMPRGSGKTALCQVACIWAALTGRTQFVTLIAASAERAEDLLENIKVWLETNELLLEDFPEVVYPIRALERIVHRQKGQKYHDEPTRVEWLTDKIVLPYIKGSVASGVVISCSGLKGSDIRGQNHARPDGKVVRPDLVMIDDPQTTESAWSPSQSKRREAILAGDVLGMAGPGMMIAGLMACTVIRPGDMADSILDRETHPDWQGQRTKMVYSFPNNKKLWEQYGDIRSDSIRNHGDISAATEFYIANRAAMDEGAEVAWPQRFNRNEVSAVQNAMNLRFRDEAAFFAEYQNEPVIETLGEEMLTPEFIANKTNGYERGALAIGVNHLTAFIDIQQKVLYWLVCGWADGFTGYVVDYGTWPKQVREYFKLNEVRITLQMEMPGAGLEGQIYHGLDQLTGELLAQKYFRDDGAQLYIDKCLIDANWGQSTEVVYQFCRQSELSARLLPSHGRYVGASSTPFSEYRRQPGEIAGLHWRMPSIQGKRKIRHLLVDINYWKSFVHTRLGVAMGDRGCLSLFGRSAEKHRLIADHLTGEFKTRTLARGQTVDEWKIKAGSPDNHWFDCLVGCAAAASMLGVSLKAVGGNNERFQRKRIRLSDIQKQKRGWV